MAGYTLKQLFHGQFVGTAVPNDTWNVVTCAAGKILLLKKAVFRYNKGAGGAVTLRLFLTDTAGANPRPINGLFTTAAGAEAGIMEAAGAAQAPGFGADTIAVSIENTVMEAGQILQLTTTAGGAVAITTQAIVSGVEYTI